MTTLPIEQKKQKFKGFSFQKFSALSFSQRHKKCSEILRSIFDGEAFQEDYRQIERWMGLDPLPDFSHYFLSERFHYHLGFCAQSVRENNLLIRENDTDFAAPPLDFVLYLDNIRSAYNVGNIVRTLEAFSLGKIAFAPEMADLSHPQVEKAAMGAQKHVEVIPLPLEKLPRPLIAFDLSDQAIPIEDFIFPAKGTLILGNEEFGLSPKTLNLLDYLVEIPLFGRKNSLNVASAFSIIAHTVRSQL